MSDELKPCGECGRWVEIPLDDGGDCNGDERIGVCQCAWRIDLSDSTPLFEGICPDDEQPDCEHWIPAPESLAARAIALVRAYTDDEICFRGEARKLARWFDERGKEDLALFVEAQFGGAGTFSTMEIDPLPMVARDMYATIAELVGLDSPVTRGYRERLAWYMIEFERREARTRGEDQC